MFYFCEYFIFGRIKSNNTHTSKKTVLKIMLDGVKSFVFKNYGGRRKKVLFIKIMLDDAQRFCL